MSERERNQLVMLLRIESMSRGVVEAYRRSVPPDDFQENIEWLEYALLRFRSDSHSVPEDVETVSVDGTELR